MNQLIFKDLPVYYVRKGHGEPIIFLHNVGTSHIIWRELMNKLKDQYDVIAFDLPGFGQSPIPADGYSINDYVELINDFITSNQLTSVKLVGNCMGSAIALKIAKNQPEKISSLILFNPLTQATFYNGYLSRSLLLKNGSFLFINLIAKFLNLFTLPNALISNILYFQLGTTGRQKKIQSTPELSSNFKQKKQITSLLNIFDDLHNYSDLDSLQSTPNLPPICTVWGNQNKVLSPKAGRNLNKTLQPILEEWLDDCGHLAMMEQPDTVIDIFHNFFNLTK